MSIYVVRSLCVRHGMEVVDEFYDDGVVATLYMLT